MAWVRPRGPGDRPAVRVVPVGSSHPPRDTPATVGTAGDTDRRLARAAFTDATLTGLARHRSPRNASREQAVRHAEVRRLALAIHDSSRALKDNRAQLQSIVGDSPGTDPRQDPAPPCSSSSAHRPRPCQTSSSRSRSPRVERWSRTVRRALCARAQRARPARHAVGDRRYAPPTIKAARPFPTRRARPFERRVLPVPPGPLGVHLDLRVVLTIRPAGACGSRGVRVEQTEAEHRRRSARRSTSPHPGHRIRRRPIPTIAPDGRVAYKRHIERFGSL